MNSIFPNPITAPKDEPLAYGGDLSSEVLIDAYTHGIFPWPCDGVIFWHSQIQELYFIPKILKFKRV